MTARRRNHVSKSEIEELAYDRRKALNERIAEGSARHNFYNGGHRRPEPSLPRLKFLEGNDP